jgi:hypothetical protein
VFELSADVCAAAGDTAELLKCLQGLVNVMYPAIEEAAAGGRLRRGDVWHRELSRAQAGEGRQAAGHRAPGLDPWGEEQGLCGGGGRKAAPAGAGPGDGLGAAAAAAAVTSPPPGTGPLAREAEVHGALLLWFLCVPARPVHAEVAKRLRALPPRLLAAHDTRLALSAASAVMRGNCVRLALCRAAAPPLLRFVLDEGSPAAAARGARAAAVAYRSLPRGALAALLGLSGGGDSGSCKAGSGASAPVVAAAAAAAGGPMGEAGGAGELATLRAALAAAAGGLGCRGAGVALADLDAQLAGGGGGGDAGELRFR